MKKLINCWRRMRLLGQNGAVKQEIDEELRFHIEQRTAENVAAGMTPEDAAREARKRFGNMQGIREELREVRGVTFGAETFQDLRFGLRMLRKNPGFTAIAVLTLALGVGVNTTMFSLANIILFRPLPFADSDRLARIYRVSSRSARDGHSVGVFMDLREQSTVFDHVAAYYPEWTFNLARAGEPAERLSGMLVSADFTSTLGVQPELGRGFLPGEDQAGHGGVVILSHEYWQLHFQGDRNIVGRTLHVDGQDVTVVGVMPERFRNAILWGKVDVLRPFTFGAEQRQNRGDNWRSAFGRLKPGVSVAQADAELKALAGRFASEHPQTEAGYGLRVLSLRDSESQHDGPVMWLSLGLASFVLLIACANLANLLLARLAGRSHELAVRMALGAGRLRLLRQLLAESLLVSLIGGSLGLLLAVWAKDLIAHLLSVRGEAGLQIPVDARVLGFTLFCCVAAALLSGTLPAWLASRKDVNSSLKENSRGNSGGGRQHRWRHALIIAEVALAFVLLSGAGLFIRGLQQYAQRDPGWRVDGLLSGQLDLTSSKYNTPEQRRAFFHELEQRLAAIPGAQLVSISSRSPVSGSRMNRDVAFEGRTPAPPGQNFFASFEPVSTGYFETIGIRLKEGRFFTPTDTTNQPGVVIISETMARQGWPNESPIGKRIGDADSKNPTWLEIVGVVTDARSPGELDGDKPMPQMYWPLAQDPPTFATVELRVNDAVDAVAPMLRRTVAGIDPDQPVYEISTSRKLIENGMRGVSLLGGILVSIAALGLVLAAIGIYGVISYTVAQRTGEIGLRMALGAQRREVLWLVLKQGFGQSLLGAGIGFAGALGVARILAAINLFPIGADPLTLIAAAVLLIAVALLACFIPARRAARVDPMVALRCE